MRKIKRENSSFSPYPQLKTLQIHDIKVKMLHIGIDVGSTTVKTVVMVPPDGGSRHESGGPGTNEIIFSRYERHNACQSEMVRTFLQEIFSKFPHEQYRLAVCGSGGRVIADMIYAPYIQEVVANSIAVRAFYPQTKVAVELGGQDAKIVFFYMIKRQTA